MTKIPTNLRKKINNKIYALTKTLHNHIVLSEIDFILREHGLFLIQEDGTPWSGFLLGENSHTTIEIGNEFGKVTNSVLAISWYRYSNTGRYETVAYIS
jgi:hypothetical protein